ncbi:immunoglobulin superfamily member 6 isoform X1 [Paralichthys olivaceus]|uniref:immunoglobulin superfamily member 6 isoform X1 n=1 Tax=Paralichthys olivaceus TaxID=8255 RepID=UPI00375341FF
MRSLTSVRATDMDRLFCVSLMLTHLPLTDSTGKEQRWREIWRKTGQVVVLPCDVSSNSSSHNYQWFVFKENSHFHLNLSGISLKHSLKGASLRIEQLNTYDSGIYHCAAVKHFQRTKNSSLVGLGTSLTVKGHVKTMVKNILLWLSFVLLLLYSVAIVTLVILKKYGCRRMGKINKQKHSTKTRFHDVLQEMNKKRHLEGGKQTSGQNGSQVETASPEFNSSTDGIYQNVKRVDEVC